MPLLLGRLLLATALLGTVGSTLRAYPHQLAYFNELAGGMCTDGACLLGSSYNWGQDYTLVLTAGRRFGGLAHSNVAVALSVSTLINIADVEVNVPHRRLSRSPAQQRMLISLDLLQSGNPNELAWTSDGFVQVGHLRRVLQNHRMERRLAGTLAVVRLTEGHFL